MPRGDRRYPWGCRRRGPAYTGDWHNHPAADQIPVDQVDADYAVRWTIETLSNLGAHPGWFPDVRFTGRITDSTAAYTKMGTIHLNVIGENLGTLLHELAHCYARGEHGADFRRYHSWIVALWDR